MQHITSTQYSKAISKEILDNHTLAEQILTSGNPLLFIKARIEQVLAIIEKHGLIMGPGTSRPDYTILVFAGKSIIENIARDQKINNLEIQGFLVKFKEANTKDYSHGTFSLSLLMVETKDRRYVPLGMIYGIAYTSTVTKAEVETRWVLQIQDKQAPSAAYEQTRRLLQENKP